jgi:TetR/AcrR family transcriptional regulator, regulator of autoinduction and epiphytic fitness
MGRYRSEVDIRRDHALDEGRSKRIRRDPDVTRKLLLDATEALMLQEGYAAVSTRRVAKNVGVNAALVHYYYPTTDDLFIAVHRRMMEGQLELLRKALDTEQPLQALWHFQTTWAQASLGLEFIALANHRTAIRDEIGPRTEEARKAQAKIIAERLSFSAALPDICTPECLNTLLIGVARTLANEEAVGITSGHAGVRALVEWMIVKFGS